MKRAITMDTINERFPQDVSLVEQEVLTRTVGENKLRHRELLRKEIEELQFHASRFASEGATLRQINQYKVVIDYLNLLYQQEDFYKCAKTSTVLKLFFGLDISFFTMLPELREEIEHRGPIYFQTLVNTAKRNVEKGPNRRGR